MTDEKDITTQPQQSEKEATGVNAFLKAAQKMIEELPECKNMSQDYALLFLMLAIYCIPPIIEAEDGE